MGIRNRFYLIYSLSPFFSLFFSLSLSLSLSFPPPPLGGKEKFFKTKYKELNFSMVNLSASPQQGGSTTYSPTFYNQSSAGDLGFTSNRAKKQIAIKYITYSVYFHNTKH